MRFEWDEDKNRKLEQERNISFERIVIAIESDHLIDILEHHNPDRYKNQYLLLINLDNYIWVVPTVISKEIYFFKTAFPSRKFTEIYLTEDRK